MMKVENTSTERIKALVAAQKEYFRSGVTLDIAFRKQMLRRLQKAMHDWEQPLAEALYADLHKSYEEAYMTELSIVTGEIRNHLRNISRWSKCKCAAASSRSRLARHLSLPPGTIPCSYCLTLWSELFRQDVPRYLNLRPMCRTLQRCWRR